MVLLTGHRSCYLLSRVRVLAEHYCVVTLGKLLIPVCLGQKSSIIWYWPRGVISLAGKVTAGLMESNGSLPQGL